MSMPSNAQKPVVAEKRKRGPAKGSQRVGGRAAGTPNKVTKALKDMILGALDDQPGGGQAYLARQAEENPTAFMGLIGKVLPMQVTGENGGPLAAKLTVEYVRPDNPAS